MLAVGEELASTGCGEAVFLMVVRGLCSCLTLPLLQGLLNLAADVR